MSESSWKLVMDSIPNEELHTINSVESLFTQLYEAAKYHREIAISFHEKDVLHSKTLRVTRRLIKLTQRYFSFSYC